MLRVRVVFNGVQGAPWLATHYFQGDTQTEASDAVTAIGAFWGSVDTWMDSEVTWATEAEVAEVNTTSGETEGVFNTTPVTGAGNVGGVMLSTAAQGLIRWRTGNFQGGREVRGRTFIPGLALSAVAGNGTLSSGTATTWNTAAAALIADANSVLAVWSRAHALSVNVVTGSAWSQFAVLRSRRD